MTAAVVGNIESQITKSSVANENSRPDNAEAEIFLKVMAFLGNFLY